MSGSPVGPVRALVLAKAPVAGRVKTRLGADVGLERAAELGGPDADPGEVAILSFAEGETTAFLVGAFMIWAASALVWALLNVKHTELATDDAPEGAAVHV